MTRLPIALAAVVAVLTATAGAAADDHPSDAPRTKSTDVVPPLPPEYHVHDGGWLTVGYHPSARERIRPVLNLADAIAQQLAAELGRPPLAHVELRVAALGEEMARLSPIEIDTSPGTTTFPEQNLIVMSLTTPLSADPPNLEASFRHHLAHLAIAEAWGGASPPAWFEEAYAVHASGQGKAARAQTLTLASLRGQLLSLDELAIRFPADLPQASIARAQSVDFVRFLLAAPSDVPFSKLVETARDGAPLSRALATTYEADGGQIEEAFREDMARRYSFLPVLFGGALLWLLLATVSVYRRVRGARPAAIADERAVAPYLADPRLAYVDRSRYPEGATVIRRSDPPPRPGEDTILPAVDVPKVEHDGRWHTLH